MALSVGPWSPAVGCAQPRTLLCRPLAGGAWSQVTAVRIAGITDATDLIATQYQVADLRANNNPGESPAVVTIRPHQVRTWG
jgi:hypothetical protein